MRKRFFWLLCLAAALALCMLCAAALADEPTWTYSKDTHTLTLTGGDFDKDHRWVKESSWSYIGRLVAEPGVRFVGDCRSLFSGLYDCAEMDLHNVDTSQMTSAINLFSGAGSALTKLNIEGWDTSAVTNMFSMFGSCSNLKTLDLSGWDVSHVTDMRSMFSGCKRLVTLNLTGWDLSAVTQMSYMFSECVSLTGLDVSQWNLASAQNLDSLFYQCASLTALDVENWNTAAVTDADSLFYGCKGLTSLNVSKWNTAAVRSTCLMFAGCEGLTELDLSGWNTFDLYPGGARFEMDGVLFLSGGRLPRIRELYEPMLESREKPTLPLREHSSCSSPLSARRAHAGLYLPSLAQRLRKRNRRKLFLRFKVNYPTIFAKYAANLDERPQSRTRAMLQMANCIQRDTASLRQHLLRYIGLQAMRRNTCANSLQNVLPCALDHYNSPF